MSKKLEKFINIFKWFMLTAFIVILYLLISTGVEYRNTGKTIEAFINDYAIALINTLSISATTVIFFYISITNKHK